MSDKDSSRYTSEHFAPSETQKSHKSRWQQSVDMELRMSKLEQSMEQLKQNTEIASSRPVSFPSGGGLYLNEEVINLRKELLEEMGKLEE